jgi:hypothetical protein
MEMASEVLNLCLKYLWKCITRLYIIYRCKYFIDFANVRNKYASYNDYAWKHHTGDLGLSCRTVTYSRCDVVWEKFQSLPAEFTNTWRSRDDLQFPGGKLKYKPFFQERHNTVWTEPVKYRHCISFMCIIHRVHTIYFKNIHISCWSYVICSIYLL